MSINKSGINRSHLKSHVDDTTEGMTLRDMLTPLFRHRKIAIISFFDGICSYDSVGVGLGRALLQFFFPGSCGTRSDGPDR